MSTLSELIDEHTAGCPIKGQKWTYLSLSELKLLLEKKGIRTCKNVISRLLKSMGIGKRKLSKSLEMKQPENRDDQFRIIKKYKQYYLSRGYAVLSIDSKKKELLGPFYRPGKNYSEQPIKCYDHDFPSFAKGKIIPYGIYDVGRNEGYLSIGRGADTAEFSVACLRKYWRQYGSKIYDSKHPILILADGGGSNGSRNKLFKQELQDWADEQGLKIRVCHYPPYCSKYNPIEHRLFPSITRALSGVMLDSIETVIQLIEQRTKLAKNTMKVFVDRINEQFEKGVKVKNEYLSYCDIRFDNILGKWNYKIMPMVYDPESYL